MDEAGRKKLLEVYAKMKSPEIREQLLIGYPQASGNFLIRSHAPGTLLHFLDYRLDFFLLLSDCPGRAYVKGNQQYP